MARPSTVTGMTRWIAVLFAVGSACFALGAAPLFVGAVGTEADSVTFFVGSLFFTTAATLQWLAGRADPARRRIDAWAALVQVAGTLFFNLSTFDDGRPAHDRPDRSAGVDADARGSLCFLVSSGLAWVATNHAAWGWRPRDRDWSMAALNLAGSVAFAVSAVASYVVPDTDQARNVALMNLGTFLGGLAFLVGALLLLPTHEEAAPAG